MKILDINPNVRQFHNRIDINEADSKVSRLMDSAQNICFVGENVVHSRTDYVYFSTPSFLESANDTLSLTELNSFAIRVNFDGGTNGAIIGKWVAGGTSGCEFLIINGLFRISKTGSVSSNNISISASGDTDIWYLFQRNANTFTIMIIQGIEIDDHYIVKDKGEFPISEIPPQSDTNILLGKTSDNLNYIAGNLKGLNIFDTTPFDLNNYNIGDVVPEMGGKTFISNIWYKKYQNKSGNKKLSLSSRNTDGAVINSASEITSIKDEFGVRFTGTNAPIITKQGFKFQKSLSQRLQSDTSGIPSLTFTELYVSVWHKPTSITTNQSFLNLTTNNGEVLRFLWSNTTNGVNKYNVVTTLNTLAPKTYPLNQYNHIACIIKNDVLYFLINGILEATTPLVFSATGRPTLFVGSWGSTQYCDAYLDEPLLTLNATEIDPTGYSVGDKVFQPDLRKSLEVRNYDGRELVNEAIKQNKLAFYANTKYLQDSGIDSTTTEINKIYQELRGGQYYFTGVEEWLEEATPSNPAKLTKNGIFCETTSKQLKSNGDGVIVGNQSNLNLMFMGWVKFDLQGGSRYPLSFGAAFDVILGSYNGNKALYLKNDGGWIDSGEAMDSVWHHFSWLRYGGNNYLLVDGVVKAIQASLSYNYYAYYPIYLNQNGFTGYVDDIAIFNDSIVDPTGAVVGDKVFTPPRRSSSQPQYVRDKAKTTILND